ncbi:MAG: aspartate aminotransferase family protein [Sneathiellaceae bacterium]
MTMAKPLQHGADAAEQPSSNSPIVTRYQERTPGSASLAAKARDMLPSGIAHDARYLQPYNIYTEEAAGARKWDVDGNEYVDYFGGHGAHLLGHNPPAVMDAVRDALERGTQFGTNHPLEVEWARMVRRLIPCAERVRFTSSGTEATHMALRLARAHTGRPRVARFMTHFHGWHDHMAGGYTSHFDGSPTPGVLPEIAKGAALVPPGDVDGMRAALREGDIAAVILEPTGASFGKVPLKPEVLVALREMTEETGTVLIFDEVITGFRVSRGGAQAALGVTPDLTTLAKIVAGGMPGGAVVGRQDIMDALDFQAMQAAGREKIDHPGTFNANPISAAAGIAALNVIAAHDVCERANGFAARLRDGMNDVLRQHRMRWAVYGEYSGFHIFTNTAGLDIDPDSFDPHALPYDVLKRGQPALNNKLRLAFLNQGVDIGAWPGGLTSSAHGEEDLQFTLAAFDHVLGALKAEGEV